MIGTVAVTLAALAAMVSLVFGGQHTHLVKNVAHNLLRYVF
jgi:hypothetical protein